MDDAGLKAKFHADSQERRAREHPLAYADVQVLPEDIDNAQVAQAISAPSAVDQQTGYDVPGYRPPPAIKAGDVPGTLQQGTTGMQGGEGAAGPVKGTQEAHRLGMQPHLQMLCGPMLRYDTTINGVYHLFALVVTRDEGSDYSTSPTITYRYGNPSARGNGSLDSAMQNMDLSASQQTYKAVGQKIWIYHSLTGSNSFWRMKLEIKLSPAAGMPVHYSLNGGRDIVFHVPGANENFRWVGHSCNGFSAGVDTEAFNGPSPLWEDLLRKHAERPIHVLVGGGDQIYCDAIAKEPELIPWIDEKDDNVKMAAPATPEIRFAIDRFLFNHYTTWFRNGAFGRAIACIPMLNMLDDHDLIDGFGSYPADLQSAPVFSLIGARGIFFYKLFQLFQCDEVDGTGASNVPHPMKSLVIGGPGPWVPFNSNSFLTYLGPDIYMLLLDCRTERKKEKIVSDVTYQRVFDAVRRLPDRVNHVVLLTGVPIAYPRMVFVESFLASKMNPLILLGKSGVAGFTGLVNRMNKDAELLDDLNDHWTAKAHKEERNWLVLQLQKIALEKHVRVSIISGDVHLAAVGRFFTHKGKIEPAHDPKYMLNVVSSAIVNTPPPQGVVGLQGKLNRTHKTLHHENTDENMVELFELDTDGSKLRNHCFMGRRNYCIVEVEQETGLKFDIRVEIAQGVGETKGYSITAPAPRW